MAPPISNIFVNGQKVMDKVKESYNFTYLLLENGTRVQLKNIKKVHIECNECKQLKEISLYHGIYEKFYLCQSCNLKGERNGFYGKKHKEELKNRLSEERKGTWYVGEKNPMYGKSPEDYLTPEQLKAKAEKNRQDTLNREYNPFKYSMREIIGDERFEESIKKAQKTRSKYTSEQKAAISKKLSDAQKRQMEEDPEGYKEKKRRGGLASASNPARYEMNNLETRVYEWLQEKNVPVIYSVVMNGGNGVFQYDFKVERERILIECQGTYWHGDPRFFNIDGTEGKRRLNDTQISMIEKDKLKKELANKYNFTLIHIWEHDVLNNDFSALTKGLDIL